MSRHALQPWKPEYLQQPVPQAPVGAALGGFLFALSGGTAAFGGAAIAGTGIFGGIFAGTSGALLLGLALTAGGAAITAARAGQRSLSAGINSNEIRLSTRQEVPPVRRIYGEVLVGGALFFEECKPPYLYMGFLLSMGPVEGLFGIQNSQTQISIDYDTFEVLSPPYVGKLYISFRSGEADQTIDPILDADFTDLDSNFRQRRIATGVIKADYGQPHNDPNAAWEDHQAMWGQSNKPNPLFKVRGVRIYDPRDPSQTRPPSRKAFDDQATFDAAWDAAEATWKWSNNATLVQTDYLIHRFGCRIDASRIRWDKISESANYDDRMIGTNDGDNIRRHTIDGVVTAGQEPFSVLQSMLTANRAIIVRSAGDMWVQSSQAQEPRMTITDDLIVGDIGFRRSKPKKGLLNRVRSRFIDPRQDWQTVDGPIIDDPDLQEEDGELLEATAEFAFTADHRRAQRLAKCHLLDSRIGREFVTTVALEALARCEDGELDPGHVVRLQSDILPRANGLYRIMEVALTENFTALQLTLAEYDPDIENDWNPETDEQDFELPDLDVS